MQMLLNAHKDIGLSVNRRKSKCMEVGVGCHRGIKVLFTSE
jgi:hypothetical protein